jgi:hypothetical protein
MPPYITRATTNFWYFLVDRYDISRVKKYKEQ